MRYGAASDTGLRRSRNEDAYLADLERGLFAVADGIGGHPGGHVASRLALQTVGASAARAHNDPIRTITTAIEDAHVAVREDGATDPRHAGMGTTAVVAALRDGHAWVAHVGDSRAYLLRDGSVRQLTRDHSLGGGRITQAIGIEVAPDVVDIDLQDGDRLLLCTDGLTDMVDDESIAVLAASEEDPQALCDRLVAAALEGGGRDNVTVMVLDP